MPKKLYIKDVEGKGRGVFCDSLIEAGETIEVCPVIEVPSSDVAVIRLSQLGDYSFHFNKEGDTLSLVMGFGSMYNYSRYANALYVLDPHQKLMIYYANEDIPANVEITINYSGEIGRDFSQWFADRSITIF